jgi:MFS family permease
MSRDPPILETQPAGGIAARPELRADLARLSALTAYWLGLSVLWGTLSTIVLPRLVEQMVPAAVKTSALSLVAGLQALVSIIVQPMAGAASDRVATPWGRRRPFIFVGVLAQLVFLLLLARAGAFWVVLVAMLLIELASNTAQGPYQGLLPDIVPADCHGLASGLIGATQLAGQVIGVAVAGVLVTSGHEEGAIAFAGAAVGLGMLTTVIAIDEPARGTVAVRPSAWLRTLVLPRHWLRPARTMLLDVWGPDVLARRDYLWLLVSRLAILMATGTLQPPRRGPRPA